MTAAVDMTGMRFTRLTVVRRAGKKRQRLLWECLCVCGTTTIVPTYLLKSGNTQSCGCLGRERLRASNVRHGLARTAEHIVWKGLTQRCLNPKHSAWHNYGGRGIKVCERWLKFENFIADMGPRPSKGHSLDRIDNDGNYEPGNVRWATRAQQSDNSRRTLVVEIRGRRMTVREIAVEFGLPRGAIHQRWRNGDRGEQLIRSYRSPAQPKVET